MYRQHTAFIRVIRRCGHLGAVVTAFVLLTMSIALGGSGVLFAVGNGHRNTTVYAQAQTPDPLNPAQYDQGYRTCRNGQCLIQNYVQPALNLMAALVGLAVTVSFIMAGIRYASSGDSPQKVSEAKQRMVTSVFVLIGFFTFYAAMNYLIPGGLR